MDVASIAASAGARNASGVIRVEDGSFTVIVDGQPLGNVSALEGAAERLATELRRRVGRAEPWSVTVQCQLNGISVSVARPATGGGGGGALHPCAARVFSEMPLDAHHALHAAAEMIRECCGR
jgi:hypothetical protein